MVMGKVKVPGGSSGETWPANSVPAASNIGLLCSSLRNAKAVSVLAEGERALKLTARKVTVMVATSLLSAGFFGSPAVGSGAAGAAGAASAGGGALAHQAHNAAEKPHPFRDHVTPETQAPRLRRAAVRVDRL